MAETQHPSKSLRQRAGVNRFRSDGGRLKPKLREKGNASRHRLRNRNRCW